MAHGQLLTSCAYQDLFAACFACLGANIVANVFRMFHILSSSFIKVSLFGFRILDGYLGNYAPLKLASQKLVVNSVALVIVQNVSVLTGWVVGTPRKLFVTGNCLLICKDNLVE